jgi:hypothetical protein
VVVADIPASAGRFMNDPQLWAGTPFAQTGNPEHILHEFIVRGIRPEWIVDIRPSAHDQREMVRLRHVEAGKQALRAVGSAVTTRLRQLTRKSG